MRTRPTILSLPLPLPLPLQLVDGKRLQEVGTSYLTKKKERGIMTYICNLLFQDKDRILKPCTSCVGYLDACIKRYTPFCVGYLSKRVQNYLGIKEMCVRQQTESVKVRYVYEPTQDEV